MGQLVGRGPAGIGSRTGLEAEITS